jgi:hypothetical protein
MATSMSLIAGMFTLEKKSSARIKSQVNRKYYFSSPVPELI